jgi:hypothetical protein
MRKQSVDALSRWIAESVRAVPRDKARKEARRLTTEFAAYAADAGINVAELEEEIGQDIMSRMEEALESAEEAGADRDLG